MAPSTSPPSASMNTTQTSASTSMPFALAQKIRDDRLQRVTFARQAAAPTTSSSEQEVTVVALSIAPDVQPGFIDSFIPLFLTAARPEPYLHVAQPCTSLLAVDDKAQKPNKSDASSTKTSEAAEGNHDRTHTQDPRPLGSDNTELSAEDPKPMPESETMRLKRRRGDPYVTFDPSASWWPHIAIVLPLTWTVNGKEHTEQITLSYWHHNLDGKSRYDGECYQIREIVEHSDLPSDLSAHLPSDVKEGCLKHGLLELTFHGRPQAENLCFNFRLGLSSDHYGPHAAHIHKCIQMLKDAHTVKLLLLGSSELAQALKRSFKLYKSAGAADAAMSLITPAVHSPTHKEIEAAVSTAKRCTPLPYMQSFPRFKELFAVDYNYSQLEVWREQGHATVFKTDAHLVETPDASQGKCILLFRQSDIEASHTLTNDVKYNWAPGLRVIIRSLAPRGWMLLGQFVDRPSYSIASHIAIHVQHAYVEGGWRAGDAEICRLVNSHLIRLSKRCFVRGLCGELMAVMRTHDKEITVSLETLPDVHAQERLSHAALRISRSLAQPNGSTGVDKSNLMAAWLGNRFASQKRLNAYANASSALIQRLTTAHQSRLDQSALISLMQNAPAGVVLAQGYPGSGKTYMLGQLLMPLLNAAPTNDRITPHKALLVSPLNMNCEALARSTRHASPYAKVYRMYTMSTEMKIARLPRHRVESMQEAINKGELAEALAMMSKFYDVPLDHRITAEELPFSLGFQVALRCVLPKRLPAESPEEFKTFRRLHDELHSDDGACYWGPTFKAAYTKAERLVINQADAIATTLALANDPRRKTIQADICVVDEASRADAMELMGVVCMDRGDNAIVVMAGDPLQIPALVDIHASHINPFIAQACVPRFTTLLLAGCEHVVLREQMRFGPDICAALTSIWCQHEMVMSPLWRPPPEKFKDALRDIRAHFGIDADDNFIAINIRHSKQQRSRNDTSRYNEISAWSAIEILARILRRRNGAIMPEQCMILTPYAAQEEELKKALQVRIEKCRKDSGGKLHGLDVKLLEDVHIATVDKFQGGERDIVIFDTTATTSLGRLEESALGFVAASRARRMYLHVINYDALSGALDQAPDGLQAQLKAWFVSHHTLGQIPRVTTTKPVQT